ncbi:hypothetical protein G6L15_08370 [Agrobacterium rhizogenes]|uniref:hypothetical protein n=1 Tax=Rhizobium rhizogenes TaxID=359 RepID=UPI001573653C|nr:hypothetical protein [Rhizobium rhizogenes]NTG86159.1 hypothetical protein [Rhizobium rhizogenes]
MGHHHGKTTFLQYLAARELGEVLLMKYSQEASEGKTVIYSDTQVLDAFNKLAERLGYRVERIAEEPVVVGEISPRGSVHSVAAE